MVMLFRCLTHDNKWLSGNECLIAFVRARSSSDPNIGDDGASMSSRLSASKNLEKVEKSELPCMRIGPKNRGCVFVDCLSRAMFLKVVTVTCNCDKLYVLSTPKTVVSAVLSDAQNRFTSLICSSVYRIKLGT